MKNVFNITNKFIVLATPLILFLIISGTYIAVSASGKFINLIIGIILFTLMTAAFIAGWFNMIKLAVTDPEMENPNNIIKEFPTGVGEYFLSAIGVIFNIFIISSIIFAAIYYIGLHTIGDLGINSQALSAALANSAALKAFLATLTKEQLIKINLWNLLLLGGMIVLYLLIFLYIPVLFFKTKNPFKAYFISLKDLFSRHFFKTLAIYVFIMTVNFFLSIFTAAFGGNIIIHFLMTLINFYFATAVGVGMFYYYYHNFVKPQLGQNIDTQV